MKVLVLTGDKTFGPGHPRYELQRSAVDELAVAYWGWGSLWPTIPTGKFDVVTVQDPFVRGLFGWYVARKLGARFNVQVHTDLAAQSLSKRLIARLVLARAHSVRVVSQKIKDYLVASSYKLTSVPTVLPVYVDVAKYQAIVRNPDHSTVLWVGRFEPEKDPLYALEVLRQVRKQRVDARLVMLGRGSLEEPLRRAAQGLPVEFAGWQDPAPYLAVAAVVLSTSRHESWGASVVEALAAGVPTVAPDVGIAREAGATVASREHLASAVVGALGSSARVTLRLPLLPPEEWARAWHDSLK